jgi:SOS-response transcriptional repressor LexA
LGEETTLTPSQSKLLERIYNHLESNHQLVKTTDSWLWQEAHVSRSAISNYIAKMVKNGYLEKRADKSLWPTQKADALVKKRENDLASFKRQPIKPLTMRIRGQVKAGQAYQDELEVDLIEFDEPGNKTLIIPETAIENNVFALQVVGNSMEQENIFEGDFVIIEEFKEYQSPQQNQLIVTYYDPIHDEDSGFDDDTEMLGPTIKYVRETQNSNGMKYYVLSWNKDAESNPQAIRAAKIKPIGKVVGVYRAIQK